MDEADARARTAAGITEEVINSVIHGLGALAGVAGLAIGMIALNSSAGFMVSFILYGICLVLLMAMSSLYHALMFSRARNVFRVLDHSGIFLLIAGSYTPFAVMLYGGWAQAGLLAMIWGLAVLGIVVRATLPNVMSRYGVAIYVALGWLALIFIPKFGNLPADALRLLITGGVLYTLGASLLAIKKPFVHSVWHLLVLLAAIAHFFAIAQLA